MVAPRGTCSGRSSARCSIRLPVICSAITELLNPLGRAREEKKTATRGEWEEFEFGYAAGTEEWLLANPNHPETRQVRDRLDAHRSTWLRGHCDVMGFAYLTLGTP